MMTYTAYDPETLEQWCSDKTNFQLFDSALHDYLQIFTETLDSRLFHAQWIGCDTAYGNGHAYSRSPLSDQQFMDTYQQRLSAILDTPDGMLSVDECGFEPELCGTRLGNLAVPA